MVSRLWTRCLRLLCSKGPEEVSWRGLPSRVLSGPGEVNSPSVKLWYRVKLTWLLRATHLPTASKIQELTDAPGGGYLVTLTDPSGFPVNMMYGALPAATGAYPEKITYNYEIEKPRVRKFQRFNIGPAAVHKV